MSLETKLQGIQIKDLGRMDYENALRYQELLRYQRNQGFIGDTILFVEHPKIYTCGVSTTEESIKELERKGLPFVKVNRGGRVTYHGPGQLVVYFILKVPIKKCPTFLRNVEYLAVDILKRIGVDAYSRRNEVDPRNKSMRLKGAWYNPEDPKKVAAIGMELVSPSPPDGTRTTMHGFALNVNTDLKAFDEIDPCDLGKGIMTSMNEILGREAPMEEVKETLIEMIKDWRPY